MLRKVPIAQYDIRVITYFVLYMVFTDNITSITTSITLENSYTLCKPKYCVFIRISVLCLVKGGMDSIE